MILVVNKKNGVGSSLIGYNLSRLYSLPLFTTATNFMLSRDYKKKFPTVKPTPKNYKKGIYDVGSHNLTKTLTHKLLLNTKLVIVPFELGYESVIKAVETVKYIQTRKPNIKVLLILNRLDKHDDERDFNYTADVKQILRDNDIRIGQPADFYDDNVYLTYLRNSYSLFSNTEQGECFLDKFYARNKALDLKRKKFSSKFDYNYYFFMHLASEFVCSDIYLDDDIYDQNKDIVTFRVDYKRFITTKARIYINNLSEKEKREFDEFLSQSYTRSHIFDIDKTTIGKILSFELFKHINEIKYDIQVDVEKYEGFEDDLFKLIYKREYPHKIVFKKDILKNITNNSYFKNKEPKLLKDLAFITYSIDNLLMMAE